MTTTSTSTPILGSLAEVARAARGGRGLPPVHTWNPPDCGDIDMRIAADGTWYYLGTPIGRPAMVRLFSSILRRDGDRYVLVTPVEKVGIKVDDAPFIAVELEALGSGRDQTLVFRTAVDDTVEAGPDRPLRVTTDPATGEPRPYVLVRDRLEALINRPVFYQLADLAEERVVEGRRVMGVWSRGAFFVLGPAEA